MRFTNYALFYNYTFIWDMLKSSSKYDLWDSNNQFDINYNYNISSTLSWECIYKFDIS